MRVPSILFILILCVPLAQATSETTWTHEFDAGYITTKPLIIDDTVYVRTSGFWTGSEDRPVVTAFDVHTGEERWTYVSETSLQHDMTPLVFVEAGIGGCGDWQDLLIVGWVDGKVTAHSPHDGSILWENQTEVELFGITGQMALEDDRIIVPTRTGVTSFCLANGNQLLEVNTGNVGWRNGVSITEKGYVIGDESGNLHTIARNGTVSTTYLGEGKIRHAPIETRHGLFVHMQTNTGSSMYLNGSLIGSAGGSPAMPLMHGDRIYASTSEAWISLLCDAQTCSIDSTVPFRSNGELSVRISGSSIEIWAPSNTPDGGWGVFNQTSLLRIEHTSFDTYGTAAPGFSEGIIALGNDAGILQVTHQESTSGKGISEDSSLIQTIHYFAILGLFLLLCRSFSVLDWSQMMKIGSAFFLVLAIAVVPELSAKLAEKTTPANEIEWDASWPNEWKQSQVIVFEIDGEERAIGGLELQDTVYELTMLACQELGIQTQVEQQYLGAYLVAFNESAGDGWEFTIDGKRSPVGMSEAQLGETSIVEWRPV